MTKNNGEFETWERDQLKDNSDALMIGIIVSKNRVIDRLHRRVSTLEKKLSKCRKEIKQAYAQKTK